MANKGARGGHPSTTFVFGRRNRATPVSLRQAASNGNRKAKSERYDPFIGPCVHTIVTRATHVESDSLGTAGWAHDPGDVQGSEYGPPRPVRARGPRMAAGSRCSGHGRLGP